MDDDFSRYVIGDNPSSNWLSLGLDEEPWQSPEERQQVLVATLSEPERSAWERYVSAKASLPPLAVLRPIEFVDDSGNVVASFGTPISQPDEEAIEKARMKLDLAYQDMVKAFTEEHWRAWESIEHDDADRVVREGPRFDKQLIQRYILRRVFDLGWTTDRFGGFDRFTIGYSGRAADKPERIG